VIKGASEVGWKKTQGASAGRDNRTTSAQRRFCTVDNLGCSSARLDAPVQCSSRYGGGMCGLLLARYLLILYWYMDPDAVLQHNPAECDLTLRRMRSAIGSQQACILISIVRDLSGIVLYAMSCDSDSSSRYRTPKMRDLLGGRGSSDSRHSRQSPP
jgi:hypothetical protein